MKNQDHQERGCECQEKSLPNCASLLEDCALIAHFKLYEDKRHNFHVTTIFIGATFEGLITLRGVLVIPSCFRFTLRTMFISSLEGGGGVKFKNSKKKKLKFLYLLVVVISF